MNPQPQLLSQIIPPADSVAATFKDKAPAAPGQLPRQRLDSLTSLRFFAAALVFFNHFAKDALAHNHASQAIQDLFQHGREAVTFFFLLSGFVLAYSYADGTRPNGMRVAAWDFWRARFARIGCG